ncbi:MAG: tyrosine-protein phosphatase [Acidobacteriota bacterium]
MKQKVFFHGLSKLALTAALACLVTLAANAGSDHKRAASGGVTVDVENFGKVNERLYRGAQPKGRQYEQLAAAGVKTVLDLREDSKDGSQADAESAGLRYINLPLRDKRYPQADAATRFLEIVNNSANWPIYMHCAGGRHRTGAMGAVYRMAVDGWDVEKAYQEMKQYDFYTSRGHECFKDYVYDYYRNLQARRPNSQVAATPAQNQWPLLKPSLPITH